MASIFDSFFASAEPFIGDIFGVPVTVIMGQTRTETVAEKRSREYSIIDEHGAVTSVRADDFVLTASELPRAPRAGDRVEQMIAEQTYTFEVMSIDGRPCTEWADESGRRIIVHTKLIGTV